MVSCLDTYSQNVYISFKSDSALTKRNCDVYFSRLKNGVTKQTIKVPTSGFYGFKCPLDESFEIVLDCWPSRKILDNILPKCGDTVIVNLDNRTFLYLKKK